MGKVKQNQGVTAYFECIGLSLIIYSHNRLIIILPVFYSKSMDYAYFLGS